MKNIIPFKLNEEQKAVIKWLDEEMQKIGKVYGRDFKFEEPSDYYYNLFNVEINKRLSAVALPVIALPKLLIDKDSAGNRKQNIRNLGTAEHIIKKYLYDVGGLPDYFRLAYTEIYVRGCESLGIPQDHIYSFDEKTYNVRAVERYCG